MNDHFTQGVAAAEAGKTADKCPFPTGKKRADWLAGFFSVKMPAPRQEKPSQKKLPA